MVKITNRYHNNDDGDDYDDDDVYEIGRGGDDGKDDVKDDDDGCYVAGYFWNPELWNYVFIYGIFYTVIYWKSTYLPIQCWYNHHIIFPNCYVISFFVLLSRDDNICHQITPLPFAIAYFCMWYLYHYISGQFPCRQVYEKFFV